MDGPSVYSFAFPSNTFYYNKFSNEGACSNPFRKKQLHSPPRERNDGTTTALQSHSETTDSSSKPFRGGQLRTLESQRLALVDTSSYPIMTSKMTYYSVRSAPVFLRRYFSQDGDRLCNYDLFQRSSLPYKSAHSSFSYRILVLCILR